MIDMEITYDHYRIFYYAAKYGSFSKAAAVLFRGQPNITKVINSLEGQLGCRLFIRSSRGAKLTPEGEILYHHVSVAFEHLEWAENKIMSGRDLDHGTLSIAATEIALYDIVLPALANFTADYPNVGIRMTNSSTPQALEALKNGLADFAVVTLHDKDKIDGFFQINDIRTCRDILCCKKGYIPDLRDKTDISEILKYPLVSLGRSTSTYGFYRNYLWGQGIHREPDIEVATADQILPIVKYGIGVGFVSEILAREALARGEIEEIPLAEPPEKRRICFVQDKKRSLTIAAKKFREYLLTERL